MKKQQKSFFSWVNTNFLFWTFVILFFLTLSYQSGTLFTDFYFAMGYLAGSFFVSYVGFLIPFSIYWAIKKRFNKTQDGSY